MTMSNRNMKDLQRIMQEYKDQTTSYLSEIKELVADRQPPKKMQFYSYFTYSTNFSHDNAMESLLIGSYHILNIGTVPITSPYICIKMSEGSPFAFSGKFIKDRTKLKRSMPGGWELLKESESKDEYWMKPLEQEQIQPGESLSFSNFQLKWQKEENYIGGLNGFFYCDENKEGTPSLNQIHLSGSFSKGGKKDESE
jgi:hypothetical protein